MDKDNIVSVKVAKGKVNYDKKILISVIKLATKEIAGVSSLSSEFGNIFQRWFNKNYDEGVKISKTRSDLCVDVYINVFYGFNVSEIAYKVQENIKNSAASMVDIKIGKINVHVIGVDFPKEIAEGELVD